MVFASPLKAHPEDAYFTQGKVQLSVGSNHGTTNSTVLALSGWLQQHPWTFRPKTQRRASESFTSTLTRKQHAETRLLGLYEKLNTVQLDATERTVPLFFYFHNFVVLQRTSLHNRKHTFVAALITTRSFCGALGLAARRPGFISIVAGL